MLDIRGNRFTEEDFDRIVTEHPDAMERIKKSGGYRLIFCLRHNLFRLFVRLIMRQRNPRTVP